MVFWQFGALKQRLKFCLFEREFQSVQVLFNGIEAIIVLTLDHAEIASPAKDHVHNNLTFGFHGRN